MNLFEALILGLVQGLTEFLPISSSGHLALFTTLLKVDSPGLGFEIWLHLATLAAVVVALRTDVAELFRALLSRVPPTPGTTRSRTLGLGILVGTMPAVVVGVWLKDVVERAFGSPHMVGVGLLLTAAILASTRLFREKDLPFTLPKAFLIGCGQALAIFPGISRSGSTLVAGSALGLRGSSAARFSFLLSIPVILGASVLEAGALREIGQSSPWVLVVGFLASGGSGLLAIRVVWRVMERGQLWLFAPYCALVGYLVLRFL